MAALISAVGAIFTAPVLQAVQSATPAPASDRPKNLKVLSKDLTVPQVREVMDTWTDELGADCSTCHVRDPKDLAPNGRPRFNYADDSKQEKATARVMYAMTEEINSRFISTVPNSGMPVTCGTCHRGHLSPEPFAAANNNSAPDKESMRIRNKVASPQ
jgi:hypothetical protein